MLPLLHSILCCDEVRHWMHKRNAKTMNNELTNNNKACSKTSRPETDAEWLLLSLSTILMNKSCLIQRTTGGVEET